MTDRYPLTLSPDGRHLVDATGRPFLLNGDAAWSLTTALTRDEVLAYLDDRAARGFTAVIVNVLEALFSPHAPANRYGDVPFSAPGDLSTPVDAYFDHVVWCIESAAERGILVMATPAYLGHATPSFPGYDNKDEGWYGAMLQSGIEACGAYGRYLGARVAQLDNIVWVLCGDRNPGAATEHVRALARGLLEARNDRFCLAHLAPESRAVDHFDESDRDWLTMNSTYSYGILHRALIRDNTSTALPHVLFETTYENEWSSSPQQIRRQAYWAMTSGAIGHCLGVFPVWCFTEGWQAALEGPASDDMGRMREFFESIDWWRLAPYQVGDFVVNKEFVRRGLGEMNGLDLATTGLSAERDLAVVYIPTARPIAVDLDVLAADAVRVWTFVPESGERFSLGDSPASGLVEIDPPGDTDWVVVIESAGIPRGNRPSDPEGETP